MSKVILPKQKKDTKNEDKKKEAGVKALRSFLAVFRSSAIVIQTIIFVVQTWYILLICILLSATMFVAVLLNSQNKSDIRVRLTAPKAQQSTSMSDTWAASVSSMGTWYFANINTYQGDSSGKDNCTGRKQYPCPLIGNKTVQDDCSAFVTACLAYGGYYPEYTGEYSFCAKDFCTGGSAYNMMLNNFVHYTPADYLTGVYKPEVGDIFAYSSHVEILGVIGETECFAYSWGSVPEDGMPTVRSCGIDTFVAQLWNSNRNKVTDIWQVKG